MRAKRTWLGLALAVLSALAVGVLVDPPGGADEKQLEEVKGGEVSNQGEQANDIDYDDEEPVSPESVTKVGDNLTVVSKTLTPPGNMAFNEFPSPNPWHFVDIETDPDAPPGSADTDTASAIQISVEGVPETAGDWPLKGEGNLNPGGGGQGTLPHWSAKISKVKLYWETYDQPAGDPNIPIDDHPTVPANGGKRIFPGKKEYNDTAEDAPKRRYVFAVVEFAEGADLPDKMYYRVWDVDDPSSDTAPIDENGAAGGDNFGKDEGERENGWHVADEDGNHISEVTMGHIMRFVDDTGTQGEEDDTCAAYLVKCTVRVGMQPGDNWRFAVAWGDGAQARLEAMTQVQADTCRPPDGVAISEMLTTWRKLHIERDSMQADSDDTNRLGHGIDTIREAVYDGKTTRLRVKDVPGSPLFGGHDWDKDDAFNGGFIEIEGEPRLVYVEDFDSRAGDDDVFVFLDYSSALGKTYWLGDDDYKRGPDEEMQMKITYPHPADISKARDALLPAYVWVENPYDGTDSAIDFQRNVSGKSAINAILETDWDLHEDGKHGNSFWNIHLVSCHQEHAEHDLDPFETEEDIVLGRSKVARVAVFVEVLRDAKISEDAGVLHEIGHGLGARDIAGISDPSKGIMCEELPLGGPYDYHFADQSLAEIRGTVHTE